MIHILLDDGIVTAYERERLSLGQVLVLACMRRLRSTHSVSQFLHKDHEAVKMVVYRIKQKGFSVEVIQNKKEEDNYKSPQEIGREKRDARRLLNYAVEKGKIEKQPCEKCGQKENIQGHHDDYKFPLRVRWLCVKHHTEHHYGT